MRVIAKGRAPQQARACGFFFNRIQTVGSHHGPLRILRPAGHHASRYTCGFLSKKKKKKENEKNEERKRKKRNNEKMTSVPFGDCRHPTFEPPNEAPALGQTNGARRPDLTRQAQPMAANGHTQSSHRLLPCVHPTKIRVQKNTLRKKVTMPTIP